MSWLITTVLPVLPPCSRPSILNKGNWCHNSLSHCYSNVVKENNVLNVFLQQNQASHIINQQWRRVQDQIYKIYDVKNVTETAYMEGIRQRLDGKQGRMRKNLVGKFCYCFFVFVFVFVYLFFTVSTGKRVNFSARTVIGGDVSRMFQRIILWNYSLELFSYIVFFVLFCVCTQSLLTRLECRVRSQCD